MIVRDRSSKVKGNHHSGTKQRFAVSQSGEQEVPPAAVCQVPAGGRDREAQLPGGGLGRRRRGQSRQGRHRGGQGCGQNRRSPAGFASDPSSPTPLMSWRSRACRSVSLSSRHLSSPPPPPLSILYLPTSGFKQFCQRILYIFHALHFYSTSKVSNVSELYLWQV